MNKSSQIGNRAICVYEGPGVRLLHTYWDGKLVRVRENKKTGEIFYNLNDTSRTLGYKDFQDYLENQPGGADWFLDHCPEALRSGWISKRTLDEIEVKQNEAQ